jgi:hypothetical protein
MLVQWCLKGVPWSTGFGDAEALRVLSHEGLTSNWVRANGGRSFMTGLVDGHAALSDAALAQHVNAYATVAATTPYVSLSAGVVERNPTTRTPIRHRAWTTALDFATGGGTGDGYVFECWVQLPGNPAPELPGFGEEVRNLNLHGRFARWHHQGEIAAKLVVPPRQIRRVLKFTISLKQLSFAAGAFNPQFVPPERVSNIRGLV